MNLMWAWIGQANDDMIQTKQNKNSKKKKKKKNRQIHKIL